MKGTFLLWRTINVVCTSGATWAAIGEYPTSIGKLSHHDGKYVPKFSVAATNDVISVTKFWAATT